MLSSTTSNVRLVGRFGLRPVMATGMAICAGALIWLAQLTATSGHLADVLPALALLGIGYGATNGAIRNADVSVNLKQIGEQDHA